MLRHRLAPLSIFLALLLSSAASRADDPALSANDLMNLPLDKLMNVEVTSVSKYAQKASEAPSAVEVITADDIRTFGFRTLGDALNGLHGLYTSSDRNYNYLGVNGFLRPGDYNSRILIMINGHRMNDNIYDGANTGQEFLLNMALVDHIEYIPGPGSSLYGANAMEGVVNVITKKGSDINGSQVEAGLGSFDTNTFRATYGKVLPNGADVLLSGSTYYSAGPDNLFFPVFNSPATNNGIAHDMDAERSNRLFGNVIYNNFTLTSGFVDRYKQVPIASFNTLFNDPAYDTVDQQAYAELKYNKAMNETTSVELKGFVQGYDYHADFPYDANGGVPPVARVINYDAVSGRWAGAEANLVTTTFERQKWVVGIEYQYDFRQHEWNYDTLPYNLYQNTNTMGSRSGVYAQDDIKITDHLVFSTGLRLDQNHMIDKLQVNPREGLIWSPLPTETVKLLYGSAFRAPNAYEQNLNTQGNAANPFNKEEHVRNYQLVNEWRPKNDFTLTAAVFNNQFTDVLTQDPTSLQFLNTGKYNAYGFDLGLDKRWANGRDIRVSFDHTILFDKSSGSNVWAVDSPKNVAKILYAEPLWGGRAKLGLENVFIDERKDEQNGIAASYDLVNLNISSKDLLPGADAALGVYNLFNAHPQMVGGMGPGVINDDQISQNVIPMNGRNAMLTLQKRF